MKSVQLQDAPYGRQYAGDGPLQRKARLLQSYYRECVLKVPAGVGPTRNSAQIYGNMLMGGETSGKNFLTDDIFAYAKWRCRDKSMYETIDEYRLFNNMLSSMPMCFNLFVPLRSAVRRGESYVDEIFRVLFPGLDIGQIIRIELEFIPVPIEEYTGDRSAFDAFVEFRTKRGEAGCIALETKYVDALGKNNPANLDAKREIARHVGCFTEEGLKALQSACPQIVRNYLLTEKYHLRHGLALSHSVILGLKEDKEIEREIAGLRRHLIPEFHDRLGKAALQDFVQVVEKHCPEEYKPWATEFYRRYLAFDSVKEEPQDPTMT